MKIIVVSDSHGNTTLLEKIKQKEFDADYFIHCGDYCLPDYYVDGFAKVCGNCDYSFETPKELNLETPFGLIHVEHGDNPLFLSNKDNYIESKKCFIFLYGHTHEKYHRKINETYVFNPGSLTRPQDSNYGSYLRIYINEKDNNLTFDYKKIDLEKEEIIKNS